MRISTPTTTKKRTLNKRLVMGFAAMASAVVVGATGLVSANANKPSKQQCQQAGYSNYGQCVSDWRKSGNHGLPGPSNGYGGSGNGNTVNTEVNLDVSGNDNVIEIIFNYVIG